jgi:DNA-directed RNA polymerase specialized sigma subunit
VHELDQTEYNDFSDFDALTEKYRPMLLHLARKVRGSFPGIEHDDLIQEGLLAIHRSTELWDPTQGTYFVVYVRRAIEQRMRSFARTYLPHLYVKDPEKSALTGKTEFKRKPIFVDNLDFNETNEKPDFD